jgi:hypothetical protein
MGTLAQQADLAADPQFQQRVQAAIQTAAANILAQAQGALGPQTYALRNALAASVMVNASDTPNLVIRFAWAVATNSTVSNDIPAGPVPIEASQVQQGGPVLVSTLTANGLTTGQVVEIEGAADPAINDTWVITVINITTFSIPVLGTLAGGAAGTITVQPPDADIATAVAACWNAVAGVNAGTN